MEEMRQVAESNRADDQFRRREGEELEERTKLQLASALRSELEEAARAGSQARLEAVAAARELAEQKEQRREEEAEAREAQWRS
eukprot:13352510-Alexandrium_andersonii.AAC.1